LDETCQVVPFRKMIFKQPLLTIFVTTLSLIFLLSLSIALIFVSIHHFLCKILVVTKVVTYMDVQITQLHTNLLIYIVKCWHFKKENVEVQDTT